MQKRERRKNPFTPTFGKTPLMLAGREQLIEDALEGLENAPGDPNRATIFTGPRGSGKTVLLAKISSEAAPLGWLSSNVTAKPGMLDDILQQLQKNAIEFLPQEAKRKIIGAQAFSFALSVENVPAPVKNWRVMMSEVLDVLNANNIGVLITVDEINPGFPELIDLVADFQQFIREERDVALIMAGLSPHLDLLIKDKTASFFRRAFRRELRVIALADVRAAMEDTIKASGRKIAADALDIMAKSTDGYPIMIQLIGYHVWKQGAEETITENDVQRGIKSAEEDMRNMVLRATVGDITDAGLRFINAMLKDDGPSKISDIARRIGESDGYASKYRVELIKQGIIASVGRGKIEIVVPRLKEYLLSDDAY